MSGKSVIIIGAGLAGLSTGCYAQMNGYRTHIFEQHTRPGGVCTAWKRKGYTIDGCIHWLMGAKPGSAYYRLYQEVGALDGNRLVYLDHFVRFVDETSGHSLDLTADLERLEADVKALSPQDGPVIEELLSGMRAFQGFNQPLDRPAELMGALDNLKQVWRVRHWLKYLTRYAMPVAEFAQRLHHPFLRWAVPNVFVPEMPTFFLFVLLAQLAAGELATVEGGSLEFALAVARRYKALGGQVTYGALVEEILVEGDRAVGIRLADGSEHRGDVVISAADGYSTIYKMLGGKYIDDSIKEQYDTWKLFTPILMVSFGVAQPFAGQPSEHALRLQKPLLVGGRQVDSMSCRLFNRDATLAPAGKTVVQMLLDADFDYWNALQADRPRYQAEKERVAAEVLDRLEAHWPGLLARVEMTDVATPYTFWRYTRNQRGAFEGWLMTPAQLSKPLRKTLPGLENLYMAGQWVEPGGGVPTALYSGRQVAQLICHRDGKPFVTTTPQAK